jgi:hypothetical protein
MKQHLLHRQEKIYRLPLALLQKRYWMSLLFALTIFLSFSPYLASAQITVTQADTDYRIRITYSGLSSGQCRCEETMSFKGYSTGFQTGSLLFNRVNSGTSGNFELVVGPGYSQSYYISTHLDGWDRLDRCTCTVAVPVCELQACNRVINASNAIGGSTVAIKAPVNVTVSNGTFDNKVVD